MIFSGKLAGLVLSGKKTETRRIVEIVEPGATKLVGPRGRRRRVDVLTLRDGITAPSHYRPKDQRHSGRYSVQRGRGRPAEAHILVTSVHRERLGNLDLQAARAEGFRTTADFFAYWEQLHPGPTLTPRAFRALQLLADVAPHPMRLQRSPAVRSLELRGLAELTPRGHELTAAGADTVALPPPGPDLDTEVWVIRFQLDQTDHPRFLRAAGTSRTYPRGPGEHPMYVHPDPPMDPEAEHGYTTSAIDCLTDEPEVLEPLDPNWKTVSDLRHKAIKQNRVTELAKIEDIAARLRAVKRASHEQGVNVRDDIRVIEKRIAAMEKKLLTRTAA